MKTSFRLAAVAATLVLVTGCNCMRHQPKGVTEPVLLPSAPTLESGAAAPSGAAAGAHAPAPTYSPLSTTAPATSQAPH